MSQQINFSMAFRVSAIKGPDASRMPVGLWSGGRDGTAGQRNPAKKVTGRAGRPFFLHKGKMTVGSASRPTPLLADPHVIFGTVFAQHQRGREHAKVGTAGEHRT
jgi:hypothetical protein